MTPFHVGMKVVCVTIFDDPRYHQEISPIKGGVYTIREIEPSRCYPSHLRFRLTEIKNEPQNYSGGFMEIWFGSVAFRPAHENRMDELRTLLAPVPSKAVERVQS